MLKTTPGLAQLSATVMEGGKDLRIAIEPNSRPLRWLAIDIEGYSADTWQGPELIVETGDGSSLAYQLAIDAGGRIHSTLYLGDEVIRGVRLRPSKGTQSATFTSLVLAPSSSAALMWTAFRESPRETSYVAYCEMAGLKVRARNWLKRILSVPSGMNYQRWLAQVEDGWQAELTAPAVAAAGDVEGGAGMGVFVLSAESEASETEPTCGLKDIGGRLRVWKTCAELQAALDGDAATQNGRDADWIWLLQRGDRPADGATKWIAKAIAANPDADLIYGDHDIEETDGQRHSPNFKPGWNAALFWAQDYIGSAIVSKRLLQAVLAGGATMDAGLVERCVFMAAKSPGRIVHVPRLLTHRSRATHERFFSLAHIEQRRTRIASQLADAGATVALDGYGNCRVRWPLPNDPPRVSLIVPTRDRLDLLKPCVEGLRFRTDYDDLEILIADNGSSDAATKAYFQQISSDPRIKVVDCSGPFNFAAINNKAVAAATGDVIGFINNDIDVIGPDWLKEMAGWALRPDIGAVGARLLYANGLVQHGGVIMGINELAGHAHRFLPATHPGFMGRLQCHQYLSAVTAACLVVERRKFDVVGGFDAEHFAVAYNDVDLCLRLNAAGFATVWTPYAELYHKETASRPRDYAPAHRERYERECAALKERWRDVLAYDAHYSPHLSRTREDFSLHEIAAKDG